MTAAANSISLSPTPETASSPIAQQFHLQLQPQQKTKDDADTSDQPNQAVASVNDQRQEPMTDMKTTEPELSWNCSSCGQNFCMQLQQQSKTGSMKTIMLKWNCYICRRDFCTSTLLNNHIRNDHKNKRSRNKPSCQYKCPCCCFKSSDFNVDEFKQHLETVHHLLVYDPHEQLSGSSNPLDEPTDQRSSPSCVCTIYLKLNILKSKNAVNN